MCGIVGIAGQLKREQLSAAVRAMNHAVFHRGPDDDGAWVGDNFAFGVRRLSIIDIAGGAQPMWDGRTRTGIVYNGEVFNYRAIRALLEKQGAVFTSECDTEVILQSLIFKGPRAVHDWNGMFAVAAWDDRRKKLLLIRDRMGVKPLYYYWDGRILMFASEIKSILAANVCRLELREQALWDYLTFRYVPGPQTIRHNVWKLPPAHMMEWSPGATPRISRYWQSDVLPAEETVDIERKSEEFSELFLDSVRQRLLASDVPVGLMLSGGLDSSSVAAAAVELGHKPQTFVVSFSEGGEYSETRYSKTVARHLGLENHEVVVDQSSFLEMLPGAVRSIDEPLADLTIVPYLAVSRLARERVKVVLSGEGADELLAGCELNRFHQKMQMIRWIQTLPSAVTNSIHRLLSLFSDRQAHLFNKAATIPLPLWNVVHKNYMTRFWNEGEKAELWPTFEGNDSDSLLYEMYGAAKSKDPLDQILAVYQQSWLVEDLLMKADKVSMAASLEMRVPFLDYRIVEWCNRQPLPVKIGRRGAGYVTKNVLRRFVSSRLPREIVDRLKKGFPIPVYRWFQESRFRRWAREHLLGSTSRLSQLLQPATVEHHLNRAAAGEEWVGHKCWLLIVMETWLREFDVHVNAGAKGKEKSIVSILLLFWSWASDAIFIDSLVDLASAVS